MSRLEVICCTQVVKRLLLCLAGQAEHQVQVKVIEAGVVCGLGRAYCLSTGMNTADLFQQAVLEALYTNRKAVDAGLPKSLEMFAVNSTRIGLQGDFRIWNQWHACADTTEQLIHVIRCKQAGSAAADEHRLHRSAPGCGQILFKVAQQGADVALLRDVITCLVRVEVAVRALAYTPGYVDVQRQGGRGVEVEHGASTVGVLSCICKI